MNNSQMSGADLFYRGTRAFSPDYSLNGRLTISLEEGRGCDRFYFYIVAAGSNESTNSVGFEYYNDYFNHNSDRIFK